MAVLVGNETYKRFVFDPEDGEARFVVKGETLDTEQFAAAVEADKDTEIERMFIMPKEGARKIWITFRPLRAADKHAIQDLTNESTGGVAPGSGRRLLIKRAVVSWDYDVPWSESILDQLDSALEDQIYGWISWGIEPLAQDPETGQPILPLEEETKPNRKQRRAASSSQKTNDTPVSPEPSEDDSSS